MPAASAPRRQEPFVLDVAQQLGRDLREEMVDRRIAAGVHVAVNRLLGYLDGTLSDGRIRELLLDATPPAPHKPGESHRYRIECTVCGQPGTVRLSVEPQDAT